MRIAILGYVVNNFPPWDPEDCKTGLPGSEECAVYASAELAKTNVVHVYMNPPNESVWKSEDSNPRWLKVDEYFNSHNSNMYDVVILWRRFDYKIGKVRGTKVYFWGHDSPNTSIKTEVKPILPTFDGMFLLSNHHVHQYQAAYQNMEPQKITICGNGIVPEQFAGTDMNKKFPLRLGYFSNYGRGLIILVMNWPYIRSKFPNAELHICYGRQTWGCISEASLKQLIILIEKHKDIGIVEHGKIGHQELIKVMSECSIWAYPCIDKGETFCITAVKAQLCGLIPVVTRIGALDETVHPDAPSIPEIKEPKDVETYIHLLCRVMSAVDNYDRSKYIEYAQKYTWKRVTDMWEKAWAS